jgi:hypothetical protein
MINKNKLILERTLMTPLDFLVKDKWRDKNVSKHKKGNTGA